jgi:hypothetical protein
VNEKQADASRIRPTHCAQCEQPIPTDSDYTFFCSMECAADWADDEALMQALKKKENA